MKLPYDTIEDLEKAVVKEYKEKAPGDLVLQENPLDEYRLNSLSDCYAEDTLEQWGPATTLLAWIREPNRDYLCADFDTVIPSILKTKSSSTLMITPALYHSGNFKNLKDLFYSVSFMETFPQTSLQPLQKLVDQTIYNSKKPSSSRYTLRPLHIVDPYLGGYAKDLWLKEIEGITYEVYMDSPVGIGLFRNQSPQALISFQPISGETLFINQIQGINGRYYAPLKDGSKKIEKTKSAKLHNNWKPLLLAATQHIAKQNHYTKLGIRSADNNYWVQKEHIPHEFAKLKYDLFAEKNGFTQETDGNWYKEIIS